ncbi:MAG: transpeptidase family protein [Ferruginibacter sp.]|nr:transpeptidase family protein [Ferruginibacter sp.]
MDIRKDILWRVYLCFLCIVAVGLAVLGKAAYIQTVEGSEWIKMGDSLHLRYQNTNAERGSIYSEDGNILSTSVPIFDVYIDFGADGLREKQGKRFVDNVDSLAYCLATLFEDKSTHEYKAELNAGYKKKSRYFALKKKISFDDYRALRDFPLVRDGKNKSGFIFERRDKRINPYVLMANRTIGISRPDSNKNVGIERTFNYLLKGESGQRLMRYVAGSYIPVEGAEVDPINGKDIILTLDTYIQDMAENALMKMLVNNNSLHGTVIVMETETGKIKAMANLGRQPDGSYIEDFNYGVGKATEPGSVFKLATLFALLKDKYVDNNSLVDCEGGVKSFYGLRIRDSHRGTGVVTVKRAFLESSNVAFAKLAFQYYANQPEKYIQHLHELRLDVPTGIEIEASSGKPYIKSPKNKSWSKTSIPYMAHGYEELVTPLHLLTFYNAVANNGKMMKPYLVNAIMDYGVTYESFKPIVLVDKIADDETISQMQECLRAVVDSQGGTGRRILKDTLYSISGKTGTAVTALDNKGYNKGNKIYQASFIGYFPSEKPKYTMAVVIQNTRESRFIYGADVSGRVFKEIADHLYKKFLNHPTKEINVPVDSSLIQTTGSYKDFANILKYMNLGYQDSANGDYWRKMSLIRQGAVLKADSALLGNMPETPDVKGMGLKDAVFLLEDKGFAVSVMGRGKVASQSVPAGKVFQRGQKILLMLN